MAERINWKPSAKLVLNPVMEDDDKAKEWIQENVKCSPWLVEGDVDFGVDSEWQGASEVLKISTQIADSVVQSAKRSVDTNAKIEDRSQNLQNLANRLNESKSLLCVLESKSLKLPISYTVNKSIQEGINCVEKFSYFTQLLELELKEWKPLGVIAIIIPGDATFDLLALKIAPVLAAGNSVILVLELDDARKLNFALLHFVWLISKSGSLAGTVSILLSEWQYLTNIIANISAEKIVYIGDLKKASVIKKNYGLKSQIVATSRRQLVIVAFDSADVDSAVEGTIDALRNLNRCNLKGEVAFRLLVQESIFKTFRRNLRDRLSRLTFGEALNHNSDFVSNDSSLISTFLNSLNKCEEDCLQIRNLDNEFLAFRTTKEALAFIGEASSEVGVHLWTENITLAMEVIQLMNAKSVMVNSGKSPLGTAEMFRDAWSGVSNGGFGEREDIWNYLTFTEETAAAPLTAKTPALAPTEIQKSVANTRSSQVAWRNLSVNAREKSLLQAVLKLKPILGSWTTIVSENSSGTIQNFSSNVTKIFNKNPVGVIGVILENVNANSALLLLLKALAFGNGVIAFANPAQKDLFEPLKILAENLLPKNIVTLVDISQVASLGSRKLDSIWHFGSQETWNRIMDAETVNNSLHLWKNESLFPTEKCLHILEYYATKSKLVIIPSGEIFAN